MMESGIVGIHLHVLIVFNVCCRDAIGGCEGTSKRVTSVNLKSINI